MLKAFVKVRLEHSGKKPDWGQGFGSHNFLMDFKAMKANLSRVKKAEIVLI